MSLGRRLSMPARGLVASVFCMSCSMQTSEGSADLSLSEINPAEVEAALAGIASLSTLSPGMTQAIQNRTSDVGSTEFNQECLVVSMALVALSEYDVGELEQAPEYAIADYFNQQLDSFNEDELPYTSDTAVRSMMWLQTKSMLANDPAVLDEYFAPCKAYYEAETA